MWALTFELLYGPQIGVTGQEGNSPREAWRGWEAPPASRGESGPGSGQA